MRSRKPKRRSASEGFRRRWRFVSSTVFSAAALVASGCGGDQAEQSEPRLPRDVGARLAAQADAVADALEAGDSCLAAERAKKLEETGSAIRADRVDAALRGELEAAVGDLVAKIECTPPAEEASEEPPPAEEEEEQAPAAPSCSELAQQIAELEAREEAVEDEEAKEELETQKDALEQELEQCERAGNGNGKGEGKGKGKGKGDEEGDD